MGQCLRAACRRGLDDEEVDDDHEDEADGQASDDEQFCEWAKYDFDTMINFLKLSIMLKPGSLVLFHAATVVFFSFLQNHVGVVVAISDLGISDLGMRSCDFRPCAS